MKNIFAIFSTTIVSLFLFTFIGNTSFHTNSLGITTVLAADNSQFQNTSPWYKNWWNFIYNKLTTTGIDFFNFGSKNPQTKVEAPINQYPALSGQNTGKPALPFPDTSQSKGIGESPDQINNAARENGTPGSPYKIEPNQFKKYCSQNTYVLYWRKGGENGRDMTKPASETATGFPETIANDSNQGARDYFQLPTCEELAKCHCCCNTCTFPQGNTCPQGWCFSKLTICDDKKECSNKCSDQCNAKCKKGCEDYKEPTHKQAFNRDCDCSVEGCPETSAKDCKIIIMDPGKTDVEYTKKEGNPEQYFKAAGMAYFTNGNGKSDPKSKIIAWPNDKADPGYVTKLKDEKGKCCKCYQDGPQIN